MRFFLLATTKQAAKDDDTHSKHKDNPQMTPTSLPERELFDLLELVESAEISGGLMPATVLRGLRF
jgi:hypothetical protein